MQRLVSAPRPDWQRRVESQGMFYHTPDGQPYWDESVCYFFTVAEIEQVEQATYALNAMYLQAVEHVITNRLFAPFDIPAPFHSYLLQSWETDARTLYGRFDLAYNGEGPPKLLEYNADTPTALLEAAVVQWFWLKDLHPEADQFNSIHERLIEAWSVIRAEMGQRVAFTSLADNLEDYMTVTYLRDTAVQAGLDTAYLTVEDIGWAATRRVFVDRDERALATIFKLYPWEWMLRDEFGVHLLQARARWLEPPWKMLLSNKAMLAMLWDLFPDSPYLLRAAREPLGQTYVRKPIWGREGSNVAIVIDGAVVAEAEGPYGNEPGVYQELASLPVFDGNLPVVGSWMVNGYACGLGIREDRGPITHNTSRFVPHFFGP